MSVDLRAEITNKYFPFNISQMFKRKKKTGLGSKHNLYSVFFFYYYYLCARSVCLHDATDFLLLFVAVGMRVAKCTYLRNLKNLFHTHVIVINTFRGMQMPRQNNPSSRRGLKTVRIMVNRH